jgi:hypothetical protein
MVFNVIYLAWKIFAVSLLLQFTLPEKKITLIVLLHFWMILSISSHVNNNP